MIYQFMDWRIGLHRRMHLFDVERLLQRLRDDNGGVLPMFLKRWEQLLIFAGEAAIPLPEHEGVAESLIPTDVYPATAWVREQYENFLKWLAEQPEHRKLLVDPPVKKPAPPIPPPAQGQGVPKSEPASPVSETKDFDTLVEGSVSNTEERQCSEPSPANSSPGSTLTGSRNFLSMGRKPPQPLPRR